MGWFKRLCLFIFGLVGIAALAALSLPWVGPWTDQATELIMNDDYFTALVVAVAITGAGLLFCLLRAIFTPRNRKSVVISTLDGGQITVTRTAIASQARHIVERDGTCIAASTHVRAKKLGHIRVSVRVTPLHALNVVDKGQQLHDELVEGLASICNDKLEEVSLEFNDPQDFEEPAGSDYEEKYLHASETDEDAGEGYEPGSSDVESDEERSGEITVPMRSSSASLQDAEEDADAQAEDDPEAEAEEDVAADGGLTEPEADSGQDSEDDDVNAYEAESEDEDLAGQEA